MSFFLCTEAFADYYRVTAPNGLNVRASANKNSEVLGQLSQGNVVDVISIENGWANINYNGWQGYVSTSYLTAVTDKGETGTSTEKESWNFFSWLFNTEGESALNANLQTRTAALREKGVIPTLGVIRVGADPSDLSYEKGATKRAELVGVDVKKFELPADATKEDVLALIDQVNADDTIHGVLMFRPLPKHLKADQNEICNRLDPKKDVDCMTHMSNAGVFEGLNDLGFAPCTPTACMEILDYYGIDCKGKSAVVIGRSLVVGKPAGMMLMGKNATVTTCHTKTVNTAEICRNADIIVSAAGVLNSLTKD